MRSRKEDSEDEESDDDSSGGGSFVVAAKAANSQQWSTSRRHSDTKKRKKHTNEEGEEWSESQQKKDIIAAFLDPNSGIHTLSIPTIFEEYAADHGWIKSNATSNIRTIKKQYEGKKGPFSEKEVNKIEPFKTRTTKSKAYTLLLKVHMNSEQSGVENMTIEQLHQSQTCFRQYPLNDFKTYNTDIRRLAMKKKEKLQLDTSALMSHMKAHPRREYTDRGLKFWDTHAAYEMLKTDLDKIEKGLLDPTTPKLLWETRKSYKEFP